MYELFKNICYYKESYNTMESSRMKVLLTVTGAWGTGSFQVASGVADGLMVRGHEVKLFFPDNRAIRRSETNSYYLNPELYHIWRYPIQKNGVALETFPLMLTDPNPRSPFGKPFKFLTKDERNLYFEQLTQALKKVIHDFKPDVIECQHIWSMDHVVRQLGFPYFVVAHNSDQLAFEFDESMQSITRESAKAALSIFAVSENVRSKVIELYGVAPEKVITIPCGYNNNLFKPVELNRQEILAKFDLDISLDAKIICFAGKMSRTKGVDILLQANQYLPDDAHIIAMGSGDIEKVMTPQEKKQCEFKRVHFLGHVSTKEVAQMNNISDCAVIPSRSEGFCIAGLEAIACGLPLVVSEGANVGRYATAKVVPNENPALLAKALKEVLDSSNDQKQKWRDEALKSASLFTWDAIVKQRLHYYKKVFS
jgi:glycosyltransferase involved in cell wall biosynthesis